MTQPRPASTHRRQQAGQSLIEAALVLTVFMALLVGVMDLAQLVYSHQSLTERVRSAVRWGTIHDWQGTEAVANLVLYDQPQAPARAREGYLGLSRENVQVTHRLPSPDRPDDETLTVTIVNFEMHTFTPGFAGVLLSRRPVSITAPMPLRSGSADRDVPRPAAPALPVVAR